MTIRAVLLVTALAATSSACGTDEDPDPTPRECSADMFDKYGQAGFEAVNTKILENITAVSSLNPSPIGDSFKGLSGDDVARVEANLLDLLIFVYGGPNNYTGESMEDAHVGLDITSEEYDAFIGMVVVPALQDVGVEAADISDCFAPPVTDPAFKASMVGI
jgi:hypothetical protein